jgi:hypothetical protein
MQNCNGINTGYTYDPNSFPIMLDNRASRCLTNTLTDFVTTPKPTNVRIRGIGNAKVAATFVGMVKWGFEDDTGQHISSNCRTHTIHRQSLVASCHSNIGPKWQQTNDKGNLLPRSTIASRCIGNSANSRKRCHTIQQPTLPLCNQRQAIAAYCTELTDDEPTTNFVTMSNVISDDEDDSSLGASTLASTSVLQTREIDIEPKSSDMTTKVVTTTANDNDNATSFSLDGPLETAVIEDEEINILDLQSELMH